jgi:hypothetical protein
MTLSKYQLSAGLLIREWNNGPLQYMKIHQYLLRYLKIRKNYISIRSIYTIDVFLKCTYIYHEASPSITVT